MISREKKKKGKEKFSLPILVLVHAEDSSFFQTHRHIDMQTLMYGIMPKSYFIRNFHIQLNCNSAIKQFIKTETQMLTIECVKSSSNFIIKNATFLMLCTSLYSQK